MLRNKKRPLIYIVDDVKLQTQQLEAMIEKEFDAKLERFVSPVAVLKKLQTCKELPDLMICDHLMPEMNGLELKRTIYSNFGKFPIIFVTGSHKEDILEEHLVVLSKPVNKGLLVTQMKRLMDPNFIVK